MVSSSSFRAHGCWWLRAADAESAAKQRKLQGPAQFHTFSFYLDKHNVTTICTKRLWDHPLSPSLLLLHSMAFLNVIVLKELKFFRCIPFLWWKARGKFKIKNCVRINQSLDLFKILVSLQSNSRKRLQPFEVTISF